MKRKNAQKGFTIIELVVVILLLGILTATALPRFMDVTADAHNSVVDAVQSGLGTSVALYHAQWYANGQPNTVAGEYIRKNYLGYPVGNTGAATSLAVNSMTTSSQCADVFRSLLQASGRPSITSKAAAATSLTTVFTAVGSTADFVAYLRNSAGERRKCAYAYTGQFTSSSLGDVPVLIYDATTGVITRGAAI